MGQVVTAIRKYRPSNGTEGEMFIAEWCDRCANGPDRKAGGCDILSRSFWNDINEPDYPVEWIEDKNGPRCTAFKAAQERRF